MDKNSSQPSTPVQRAESFYFDYDPMAIFLVEKQLFRVHRHFFIQGSAIFRDMFYQAKTCEETEGMSDDKPIVLPNVTLKEFKTLLRYFYAMTSPTSNKKSLADVLAFEQDEKLALLSIAHQFCFDQISEYILGEIEPGMFPVVARVCLGDKYDLKTWLSSAYETILERTPDQKLSREEVDALGLDRTVRILEAKNFMLHKVHDQCLKKSNVPICTKRNIFQERCDCCTRWMDFESAGGSAAIRKSDVALAVENLLS